MIIELNPAKALVDMLPQIDVAAVAEISTLLEEFFDPLWSAASRTTIYFYSFT